MCTPGVPLDPATSLSIISFKTDKSNIWRTNGWLLPIIGRGSGGPSTCVLGRLDSHSREAPVDHHCHVLLLSVELDLKVNIININGRLTVAFNRSACPVYILQ